MGRLGAETIEKKEPARFLASEAGTFTVEVAGFRVA